MFTCEIFNFFQKKLTVMKIIKKNLIIYRGYNCFFIKLSLLTFLLKNRLFVTVTFQHVESLWVLHLKKKKKIIIFTKICFFRNVYEKIRSFPKYSRHSIFTIIMFYLPRQKCGGGASGKKKYFTRISSSAAVSFSLFYSLSLPERFEYNVQTPDGFFFLLIFYDVFPYLYFTLVLLARGLSNGGVRLRLYIKIHTYNGSPTDRHRNTITTTRIVCTLRDTIR